MLAAHFLKWNKTQYVTRKRKARQKKKGNAIATYRDRAASHIHGVKQGAMWGNDAVRPALSFFENHAGLHNCSQRSTEGKESDTVHAYPVCQEIGFACLPQIYSAQTIKLHYSQFKYMLIVSWEYIDVQGSVTVPLKIAQCCKGNS